MTSKSLIARMAANYGVDPAKLYETLKMTAFKQRDGSAPTNEQMMALLIVADQYGLNPFTKEIYAFAGKGGEIVPVVAVDGWTRIINDHPMLDGIEFVYSETSTTPTRGQSCPEWMECVIYRKDRTQPTRVREWLDETYQAPRGSSFDGPWQTHTKRMLRHKSLIQCARVAFSFGGIYEPDEAARIIEAQKPGISNTTQAALSYSQEELDGQIAMLQKRSVDIGITGVKNYINQRFRGADLDYVLAGVEQRQAIEAETHVIEHEPHSAEMLQEEFYQEHGQP